MADEHIPAQKLHAYVMGQVSSAEAGEMEAHLGRCPECRQQLTSHLRPADAEPEDSRPPPSLELPETMELSDIPSQVSVSMVPHTIESYDRPSVTSISQSPMSHEAGPPRRGHRRTLLVVAVVLALGVLAAIAVAVVLQPRVRAASLTRQAREALQPVVASQRLADLQHLALRGTAPYVPGADAQVEQRLTDAEEALLVVVDLDGSNTEARSMLALTRLMRGELAEARGHYLEIEALLGPTSDSQLGLGILDYLAGTVANDPADREYSFGQARERFSSLKLGDRGYSEAVYNRCVVALARGDLSEATRLQQVYSELQPDSPWAVELSDLVGVALE